MRPFDHIGLRPRACLLAALCFIAGLGCDTPAGTSEPAAQAEAPQENSGVDEPVAPGEEDDSSAPTPPKTDDSPAPKPPKTKQHDPLMALMDAICDAGEATERGCKACPAFTLQKDDDQPFQLIASAGANLTSSTTRERLVTFQGCTTHSANDRWTVLVARRQDQWRRITELANTDVDECKRLENADGREMVACVRRDAARGTNTTSVHALIATPGGKISTRMLTSVEGHPGKCQRGTYRLDELRDVYGKDADDDGDEDLYVMIDKRNGQVPERLDSTCSKGFYAPRESERFIFVNKGTKLACCR